MTNQGIPGPKPVFFLVAAIHPREIVSAEIATRFVASLLANYGADPDVTWILDAHEVVVVPIANPDGHKLAEQGYMQRKNANTSYGGDCADPPEAGNHFGVDLNRNFAFQWGTVAKPTIGVCDQTFPGPTPASEPETRSLQALVESLYPGHTAPVVGEPVGEDTSGVLISLHSYAEKVLWPWGYTSDPPTDGPALQQLGERLAQFNGYTPQQAVRFYPTSGTIEDWAYGTLGVASYTIEIGPPPDRLNYCSGFMPPHECLDIANGVGFWGENAPALQYAARVARSPYGQPGGPQVRSVAVVSDTWPLLLTATLDGGQQPVLAAEAYIGKAPWDGGTPLALEPLDGAFDSPLEQAQLVVPWHGAPATAGTDQWVAGGGREPQNEPVLALVRGQNAAGTWGPMHAAWLSDGAGGGGDDQVFWTWLPLMLAPEEGPVYR
ncbi:MAG: hypothetical protein HC884_11530 [Chloroflexaceae bacterium]|nr:hypothetical protein [Chloroflexaceae bacterium]